MYKMNSDELRDEPQEVQEQPINYAEFANGAYGGKDLSHLGYEIDHQHSNRNRTLYVSRDSNKQILAFRGTDLSSKQNKWKDLGSDILLALNLKNVSSRFRNAKKSTKRIIDQYGPNNLTLTGFSLGGSQALYANSKFSLPTVVYNPGIGPSDAIQGIKKKTFDNLTLSLFKRPIKNNATIFHTAKDPISMLSPFVDGTSIQKVKKKKGINAHSLSNFL